MWRSVETVFSEGSVEGYKSKDRITRPISRERNLQAWTLLSRTGDRGKGSHIVVSRVCGTDLCYRRQSMTFSRSFGRY